VTSSPTGTASDPDVHDRVLEVAARVSNVVAHGLNNLMTALSGYLEIARGRLESTHAAAAAFAEGGRAVERLAEGLQRLAGFARRLRLDPRAVDLRAFLGSRIPVLQRLAGEEATFAVEDSGEALRVRADVGALEEALAVVLANARDATGGRGRVTLRVDRLASGLGGQPASRIAVADDGPGIPTEIRDRLFEPFVTTKSKQGATGLGLAWLRGMAKQSGGEARIASTPGYGTTVALLLPMAAEDEPLAPEEPLPPGGGDVALVVEGERARRETDAAVLEGCGWRVLRAADGDEAEAALGTAQGRVVAVVASFLPRLDGAHVAARLEAARPGTAVLLVVGAVPFASSTVGDRPVLHRPYTWTALARAARETLDARPGP
jgi:hypothetical protein